MDQRREKGVVIIILAIYTFDMHIYTTHRLKMEMNQRREKEGVVILVIYTFDMHINSQTKNGDESENRKRRSGYS